METLLIQYHWTHCVEEARFWLLHCNVILYLLPLAFPSKAAAAPSLWAFNNSKGPLSHFSKDSLTLHSVCQGGLTISLQLSRHLTKETSSVLKGPSVPEESFATHMEDNINTTAFPLGMTIS